MIRNVSESQDEILENIIALHIPGGFEVDPCYGKGAFYKSGRIQRPSLCLDVIPSESSVEMGDVQQLHKRVRDVRAIVFDPPFIHSHGKGSAIGNRYQSYVNQKALWAFYERAFAAIYTTLRPGGILVWKCQDIIESRKQVWNHCKIWELCTARGMTALDLFVLVAKHRITGHNHAAQQHARKFTSYFWVFKKGKD